MEEGEYLLLFHDTDQRLFDEGLSIVIGVSITPVYAWCTLD